MKSLAEPVIDSENNRKDQQSQCDSMLNYIIIRKLLMKLKVPNKQYIKAMNKTACRTSYVQESFIENAKRKLSLIHRVNANLNKERFKRKFITSVPAKSIIIESYETNKKKHKDDKIKFKEI